SIIYNLSLDYDICNGAWHALWLMIKIRPEVVLISFISIILLTQSIPLYLCWPSHVTHR
ncbi:hypothetical protein S83_043962, partial [Arachis hypogaea]